MPPNTVYILSENLDRTVQKWLDTKGFTTEYFSQVDDFIAQADLTQPNCVLMQLNGSVQHYAKAIRQLTVQHSPMQAVIIESHDTLFSEQYSSTCSSLPFIDLPPDLIALETAVTRAFQHGAEKQQMNAMARIYCHEFTARELEIAQQLAKKKTIADIAQYLFLSPTTVEKYVCRIKEKTACQTIDALLALLVDYPPESVMPRETHL
ncbi:response regulator transcription factor [Pseudoalteromonas luteoviolacea]|uniref:helix-turn-helix transcriptional regulator n=1 Tax=Pseudoalteromonas luteoviolacea TaxID=43657 RepID=UPI001B37A518|nr:LuxR C-terminal-related transcriptional regulator [Pseudoalteromonas luteoviolacea]MBQ4813936.1 response regulator transcription factor [Pseudoalteromonas luteoviolacea]